MRRFPRIVLAAVGLIVAGSAPVAAGEDARPRPRAPGDAQVIETDQAGAYFIERPLKEKYDGLLRKLAGLRREIDAVAIEPKEARRQLDRVGGELEELRRQIERVRVYVPAAHLHHATTTEAIAIAPADLLLIDAGQLEVRGGDGAEVRCLLEKTVLSKDGKGVDDELKGIRLEVRRSSGDKVFGFYKAIAGKPEWKAQWEQFPFKDFLGRDFPHVSIVGLTGEEGNRQISLEMKNEQGAGISASRWRRQAKLVVTVPPCRRVGVRGGLTGFLASGLRASLTILGDGDRDYEATNAIRDQVGAVAVEGLPLHLLDGIKGDVAIAATDYAENVANIHDDRGVTIDPGAVRPTDLRVIAGDLTIRAVRSDLNLAGIEGRIDVENDFGRTTWTVDCPIAPRDHRLVSQGGAIEIRVGDDRFKGTDVTVYSECGTIRLLPGIDLGLTSSSFHSASEDGRRRSWHGFVSGRGSASGGLERFERVSAALFRRSRSPGLDILNRGGTISIRPPGERP